MDARIKTFQLSLAIHALIFAFFLWHGNPVLLPERLITVELGDVEAKQSSARSTGGYERKTQNAKAVDRPPQDIAAKVHEQSAVSQTVEEEPLVPVKEKPVETDTVRWAEPTDNRRALPPLPVAGGDEGLASHGNGITENNGSSSSAGNSGNSGENAKNLYVEERFAYIRDTIMKNLSYPPTARRMGWEGKVTVSFVISEDGYASEIKIVESSGFGVLDRNAVETVKKASPFPKPPIRTELVMPVVYKLR